jgi:hypothetical protein
MANTSSSNDVPSVNTSSDVRVHVIDPCFERWYCPAPVAMLVAFGISHWVIIFVGILGNVFVVAVIVITPKMLRVCVHVSASTLHFSRQSIFFCSIWR